MQRLIRAYRCNPFLNDAPLKLRNGHEDVQLKLACRVHAAGVNSLVGTDQRNLVSGQLTHNLRKVRQAPAKPIQLEAYNDIQLSFAHVRKHRRLGLGAALLSHASEWALAETGIEWIDLQVLSANEPAMRLYLRSGFGKVGEVAEMFKIDGSLFSFTTMTKRLREDRPGTG
jgi:GNAT superfamily N-acetyltransferase